MVQSSGFVFRFGIWVVAASVLLSAVGVRAQEDMPDPSLIHGRAIPAAELPDGTVTVRVVREAIGNNLPGQEVEVAVGDVATTATTDELGRAEFTALPRGGQAVAEATVEGERLTSETFTVPSSGGLRVILVAGIERAAARAAAEDAAAAAEPPVEGIVVFGGQSRVLAFYNRESDGYDVYYVLELLNSARRRVDVGEPLVIDLPAEATGATPIEGSSPVASVEGNRVVLTGPFPSGTTPVQVAFRLPVAGETLTLTQAWPAAMSQVIVAFEKPVEGVRLSSPQANEYEERVDNEGRVFLFGFGPGLPAGGTMSASVSGLPAHSPVSLFVALGLAAAIVALGTWLSLGGRASRAGERQALVARRDTLLGQLAKLESNRRAGSVDPGTYARRRGRLLEDLEAIYAELDEIHDGPAGGGEGVAA
jgi:hypothetical protein